MDLWVGAAVAVLLLGLNAALLWKRFFSKRTPDTATRRPSMGRTGAGRPPLAGASFEVDGSGHVRAIGTTSGPAPIPRGQRVEVAACGRSDKGLNRPKNEDALLSAPSRGLFAVADGIGGHSGGDVASELSVRALESGLGSPSIEGLPPPAASLVGAVRAANRAVRDHRCAVNLDMGTTLTAALFDGQRAAVYVAHIGDSRVYRIRDGHAQRLTRDHTSPVGGRDRLVRAIGMHDQVNVDVHVVDARTRDVFVLCTDGLWSHMPASRMTSILRRHREPEDAARTLIADAVAAGSRDDVSVVVVRVTDGG